MIKMGMPIPEDKGRKIVLNPETYPGLEPQDSSRRMILFWIFPPHGADHVSFSVFENASGFLVRRIRYDYGASYFSPITYGADAFLPNSMPKFLESFDNALIALGSNIERKPSLGIDGIYYGISWNLSQTKGNYSWSTFDATPPPFAELFHNTVKFLHTLFPGNTDK